MRKISALYINLILSISRCLYLFYGLLFIVVMYTAAMMIMENHISSKATQRTLMMTRITVSQSVCNETQHIAFIKVHKAGSTTLMNVIQRFGMKRNLSFMLPPSGNYLSKTRPLRYSDFMPPPRGKPFSISCNHVIYNRKVFNDVLASDTVYIAILRDPWAQFLSAFVYYSRYYSVYYLMSIPGPDKLSNYLKDPMKYDSNPALSFTNNRMSVDMGIPPSLFNNKQLINQYIDALGKELNLVLIMEHFEESMILLRRHMCWKIQDILYIVKNANSKNKNLNTTVEQMDAFKKWAETDYQLYNYFYAKFFEKIADETSDFHSEVLVYKNILRKVSSYCGDNSAKHNGTRASLRIAKSMWNDEITVSFADCDLMTCNELKLVDAIRTSQYKNELVVRTSKSKLNREQLKKAMISIAKA